MKLVKLEFNHYLILNWGNYRILSELTELVQNPVVGATIGLTEIRRLYEDGDLFNHG